MDTQKKWTLLSIKILIVFFVVMVQFFIPQETVTAICSDIGNYFQGYFLLVGLLVYTIFLALPYFPGIELGIALIILFKEQGLILVYFTTIFSLVLSYSIGRYFTHDQKLAQKAKNILSSGLIERLEKFHPSILLIVLLNIPGNIAIGGGGGIALTYGLLKKTSPLAFAIYSAIAVSPLPILFYFGFKAGGLT